jgi:hypothetical protein
LHLLPSINSFCSTIEVKAGLQGSRENHNSDAAAAANATINPNPT